jgi:hypothetical protein
VSGVQEPAVKTRFIRQKTPAAFSIRSEILRKRPEKPEKADAYGGNADPHPPVLPYRTGFDKIVRAGMPVVFPG